MNVVKNKLALCALLVTCACSSVALGKDLYDDSTASTVDDVPEYAQKKYSLALSGDRYMSSVATSDWALSGLELYRKLDDNISEKYGYNYAARIALMLSRATVAFHIAMLNHEIGGHGFRGKESGLGVSYNVSLFSGSTSYNKPFTKIHNQLAAEAGGMQASHILAENIKMKFYESDKINPVHGISYLFAQGDQPNYVFITRYEKSGNDVRHYIEKTNQLYGSAYLSRSKVKSYAYLDLIDPFLYYSLYSFATSNEIDIPMIQLGKIKYLPATRVVLAPYGLEKRLVNHFKIDDKYMRVSLSYGKNKQFKSYSLDVLTNQIVKLNRISFGGQIVFWSQPKMLTATPLNEKVKKGFMLLANSEVDVISNIKIIFSAGYKTAGFVEGHPLKASPLIKAGLKLGF